ncbi:refilin-A isoform X2 [Varanus komodoensis]|uniref:refilin-A isoform X2 n=1 Tax=Varanus komodoensis TaxID=61221 RepID=UPI001CF77210|nr:refilin-A isoform X2 [Varanus komodoensis]
MKAEAETGQLERQDPAPRHAEWREPTGEASACSAAVRLPAREGGSPSAWQPLPSPPRSVMVGHLQLQGMEDSLKEKNREGLLDSPDSGLPPSPSPPFYSLSPGIAESRAGGSGSSMEFLGHRKDGREGKLIPYVLLNASASEIRPRLYPVFFGESIEVNPEPAQEIRCNSEIKYGSERHYRDDVFYCPMPTITTYRETVIAAPNCTWRNYKSQLIFEPRQKPLRFQSTTIIFPKHARNIYRTTLNCSLGSAKKWFASSVQLELCEENSPCIVYTETL